MFREDYLVSQKSAGLTYNCYSVIILYSVVIYVAKYRDQLFHEV